MSWAHFLHSDEAKITPPAQKKLDVELVEPVYKNGVLSTTKGGTIKGEDLFLQARQIEYIRRVENGKPVHRIIAEGDLFFLYKGKAYTGDKIELDADERTSTIYNGVATVDQWFVGGKKIELNSDGSGTIFDGYLTTSENERSDWTIQSPKVTLSRNSTVKAKNVSFYFVKMPILWLPTMSSDLKTSFGFPFKVRFRWGGQLGKMLGFTYELYKTENFKTNLLFDVTTRKGVGGGFTTHYHNPNGKEHLFTYNYIAHDRVGKKIDKPIRYRVLGEYENKFFNESVDFKASYDKLSDIDMRSDYVNKELSSTRIKPTEARFSKSTENYASSLNTKIRANTFQTIKKELPLFQFNARPLELGSSHLILANRFNAGYLDYKYARRTPHVENFHSSRIELSQKLYRNFLFGGLSLTPHIGYQAISYNNSPQGNAKFLAIGKVGAECHTRLVHPLTQGSDALEPYVDYQYLTDPTVSPPKHYLFDLQDGWHRVNQLRFGARNFFTFRTDDPFLRRLYIDAYARSFFHTKAIGRSIPRVYTDLNFKATPETSYFANIAWDTKRKYFDHTNVGVMKTFSEYAAATFEYRHRSAYAWRKLDPDNFIVDSFRKESRLRHSELSDRRNAILAKLFLRFTESFAVDLQTIHGFHRKRHPRYTIYRADVIMLLRGALEVTFSIEKRSGEKQPRCSVEFSLGMEKPHASQSRKIGHINYDN